ncbi:16S rRNA (adenine(1518)-N(6)/adenine(1519)-N(6))-dimethyltransferase RsmA [Alcanivorax sp. JB21]|uniref:16S rRNA (adenine(1518)-N(6)/adenine(1519)-N(6))- dimethyltransferase RsmA n=1 Tax=Alcanivorax limicola TaxID=2874102 RepID=UPI001CC0D3D3|nr:16S rRNA (adenine(1518)-N(6)/adenine(1519)-N(6))-dimethyltransferase RsmA [Alcanivorax limicola]MBZ2190080.1 16S rRNA (adenine(1518)-N(6)/adenine(1519)-N(6))-dimethyltransferase RsmA [Alcanivorax limicola]
MARHQARKRFGQHFLTDTNLIHRLVRSIAPARDDRMVEIGPGQGALTRPLLDAVDHLHAVELDRDLIRLLERQIAPERLTVHAADALRFDFRTLATDDKPLRVVGNLPYNISTPLMFHLISQMDVIRDMHFMLQKEMVDRLVASPGTSDWGRLSVMIQYHCDTDFLFTVPPEAFSPPPRVDSAIVRLTPHATLPHPARDYRFFAGLVNQVFTQRRKAIRNGLKSLMTMADIEAAGVDPGLRPDQLSLADFVSLANAAPPQEGSPSQETAP